jgi:peroxiredoxin
MDAPKGEGRFGGIVVEAKESPMVRFAVAVLLAGVVLASPTLAGEFNKTVSIGDAAPTWSNLPGTDGKKHSLADLKDKDVVVVAITCNHCPVATKYEDRLIAFAKKYADKKVALVAINVSHEDEDKFPAMKERAKEKGFPFPYLQDESQKIGKALGATVTPEIFVLNKERKIVYMGRVDDSWQFPAKVKQKYLEDAVNALLESKKIAKTETSPYGCSVIYKEEK